MDAEERKKKIALLKGGQIVKIDGLSFSAKRIDEDESLCPCNYCNVDCLCKGNVAKICDELDFLSKYRWILYLE